MKIGQWFAEVCGRLWSGCKHCQDWACLKCEIAVPLRLQSSQSEFLTGHALQIARRERGAVGHLCRGLRPTKGTLISEDQRATYVRGDSPSTAQRPGGLTQLFCSQEVFRKWEKITVWSAAQIFSGAAGLSRKQRERVFLPVKRFGATYIVNYSFHWQLRWRYRVWTRLLLNKEHSDNNLNSVLHTTCPLTTLHAANQLARRTLLAIGIPLRSCDKSDDINAKKTPMFNEIRRVDSFPTMKCSLPPYIYSKQQKNDQVLHWKCLVTSVQRASKWPSE